MIMTNNESRECIFIAVLVVAALSMTGCGQQLSGKYFSQKEKTAVGSIQHEIDFKSGNKANFTSNILGGTSTVEVDYEVHSKEVVIKAGKRNIVAKITDDGCLDFGRRDFGSDLGVGRPIGKMCRLAEK